MRQELVRKRKELAEAEKVAIRIGCNEKVRCIKRLTKKIDYGFSDPKFYGQSLEIETPNFTIATPHKEKGRI